MKSVFKVGDRVQMHPATDLWMRGDRYGTVVKSDRGAYRAAVLLDKSGRTVRIYPVSLLPVE